MDELDRLIGEVGKTNKRIAAKFGNLSMVMKKLDRASGRDLYQLPFVTLSYSSLSGGLKFRTYRSTDPHQSYVSYALTVGCLRLLVTMPKSWREFGAALLEM